MSSAVDKYISIRDRQRSWSLQAAPKDFSYRQSLLKQLKKLLEDNEDAWLKALKKDLHKPPVEAYASEIGVLLNELEEALENLSEWMKPEIRRRFLLTGVERVEISRRPYGSLLVIAPWNYPLQLALMPVIGALAAGNSVVLKPSEFAPATSRLLGELVPEYFKVEQFTVIEGDEKTAKQLTDIAWDFIFFTGSEKTGKKVYKAAAEHLTPVLLELGGKNPCILDETGFNNQAIQQILWSKFLNSGQSCIAPDTVYVSRNIYEKCLEKMRHYLQIFYGKNPAHSESYGRLISEEHYKKVTSFFKDGRIFYGGASSKESLYVSPTLLVDVQPRSPAATEEIFGPILPVIPYDDLDILMEELAEQSVPLVTYVYSEDKEVISKIDCGLESGTLSQNQGIVHSASPHLPFGGKEKSGIGRYHGKASFQAMSVEKSHYTKKPFVSSSKQYPPYGQAAFQAVRKFREYLF